MTCIRLSQLLEYEMPHYKRILQERKQYFDNITKEDVWMYLVERDFQKRFFNSWAEQEKEGFCRGCDINGGCELGIIKTQK
ncbi:MAG: hypothetical protein AABW67_04030 [Nanoarchaeota archaeon]